MKLTKPDRPADWVFHGDYVEHFWFDEMVFYSFELDCCRMFARDGLLFISCNGEDMELNGGDLYQVFERHLARAITDSCINDDVQNIESEVKDAPN